MLAAPLSWRSGLWWLSWEWWRWCFYCGIKLLCSLLHTMTWRIIKPRKLEKFPRATSRKVQWRPGVGKESTGLKDCVDICSAWWWAESAVESLFCKTLLVPGNLSVCKPGVNILLTALHCFLPLLPDMTRIRWSYALRSLYVGMCDIRVALVWG